MRLSKKLFGGVVALALLTSLVGCGDDIECGAGTVERDGTCVPVSTITCGDGTEAVGGQCVPVDDLCPEGQVYVGGDCVPEGAECADGTVLEDGECVPLCAEDEVWDPDDAVCRDETGCATGTHLVEGECVPDDNLCPTGQVWVDGGCVDEVGCGEGTILDTVTDECVPIDPMDDVDVMEADEPNDIFLGGDPGLFVVPTTLDETIILGGVIDEVEDLDGDPETLEPDFDTFAFTGFAGDRLLIESTAVGAPSVAYALLFADEEGYITFSRFGMPLGSRNAMREVVLPFDGTYFLYVGDRFNMFQWFGFAYDLGEYDGNAGYTYMVAVTPIANPNPTPVALAAFPFVGTGDLADIPQFLVNLAAGSVVEMMIEADSYDVGGLYWASAADYDPFLGEYNAGFHAIPTGGLLVTADYQYALARDTGYTLSGEIVPVTELTIGATPIARNDDAIEPYDYRFYRFTLNAARVMDFAFDSTESDAYLVMFLTDADLNVLFYWPQWIFGPYPDQWGQMTVALEAGTYFLIMSEYTDYPYEDDTFTYDLDIMNYLLDPIEGGVLPVTDADFIIEETGLGMLDEDGDQAFFTFESEEVGNLFFTASPDENLDVDISVFDYFVLGVDFEWYPVLESYMGGLGDDEELEWVTGPQPYYVLAFAYEVAGTGTKDTFDLTAEIEFPDWLIPEIEPNDLPEDATEFGELTLDESLMGYGDQHYSVNDVTVDYWMFSLAEPSSLMLETHSLGAEPVDTVLWLYDEDENELSFDDDGGEGVNSYIEMALPAGTYFAAVDNYWMEEAELYLLETLVDLEYAFCAPDWQSCATGATAVEVCNADGTATDLFDCGGDCVDGECEAILEEETAIGDNDDAGHAEHIGNVGDSDRRLIDGAVLAGADSTTDDDYYSFTLTGTSWVEIGTLQNGDSTFDTEIWLYSLSALGTGGIATLIDSDDDSGPGLYSLLSFRSLDPLLLPAFDAPLPAGHYAVRVAYYSETGLTGGLYYLYINTFEPECLMGAAPTCGTGEVRSYCLDYENYPITCLDDCASGACNEPTWDFVGTATIADEDEVDRWGFTFTVVGTVDTLLFDLGPHTGTAPDVEAKLCEVNGELCVGGNILAQGSEFSFDFIGSAYQTGEYYLEVMSDEGVGTYDISIQALACVVGANVCSADGTYITTYDTDCSLTGTVIETCEYQCMGSGSAVACDMELEPNNTAATATDLGELTVLLPVNGVVDPSGDVDWFLFTIDEPAVVSFETMAPLAGTPIGDTQLGVYEWNVPGVSTTQLAYNDDISYPSNTYSRIEYLYLPANPGTAVEYLVRVNGFSDYTGAYRLEITPDTMPVECVPGSDAVCNGPDLDFCTDLGVPDTLTCISDDCDDFGGVDYCGYEAETEPNDGAGDYDPIGTVDDGLAIVEARLESSTDEDWFEFTVTGTADLTIETMPSWVGTAYAGGDTYIYLYAEGTGTPGTPDTTYIYYDDDVSYPSNKYSLLGPVELEPGTYWLRVWDYWESEVFDYRIEFLAVPVATSP